MSSRAKRSRSCHRTRYAKCETRKSKIRNLRAKADNNLKPSFVKGIALQSSYLQRSTKANRNIVLTLPTLVTTVEFGYWIGVCETRNTGVLCSGSSTAKVC